MSLMVIVAILVYSSPLMGIQERDGLVLSIIVPDAL